MNSKSNTPNEKQRKVIDLIHRRQLIEFGTEQDVAMDHDTECAEPLLRLIHGLPGSGKTELLLWIQTYFEDVWGWTLGNEFVFLAPLNSMASNCGGVTVHSWGKIQFPFSFMAPSGLANLPRRRNSNYSGSKLQTLHLHGSPVGILKGTWPSSSFNGCSITHGKQKGSYRCYLVAWICPSE